MVITVAGDLRLPRGSDPARLSTVHRRCWHAGDPTDANWEGVQRAVREPIVIGAHGVTIAGGSVGQRGYQATG